MVVCQVAGRTHWPQPKHTSIWIVAGANSPPSAVMESDLGLSLILEELLQDRDDAAGLRQVAMLGPGVLQQHVPIAAALQELAAAE